MKNNDLFAKKSATELKAEERARPRLAAASRVGLQEVLGGLVRILRGVELATAHKDREGVAVDGAVVVGLEALEALRRTVR